MKAKKLAKNPKKCKMKMGILVRIAQINWNIEP